MADAHAPEYRRYPVGDGGGSEWMLVHGPEAGARVLELRFSGTQYP